MTGPRRLRAVPGQVGVRTVLYRRVSAVMGRAGEEFLSPDLQASAMRELIRRRGLLEVAVIDDIDVSGRTFEREGIQRVLAMARAGEVDVVALYDLSRLGRNTAESLRTIAELRDLGVSVISTVEQIDDTPEGQFQLSVFLGMAQLYSDQVARRWQQVITHRAEQGLFHGSVPPFGYRRAGRMIELDPVLAPQVREVFRRYAAGERIWHIARDWNASTGRRTSYVVLKKMLRNPVYIGRVVVNGQEFPGRHEPLVSEALWRRVQRRLAEDRRTPSRRLAVANPLAGLALCDHCDRHLQRHHDKPRGDAVLQCRGAREFRDCVGPGTPVLAAVEAAVLDWVDREVGRLNVDVGAARAARSARHAAAVVDVRRLRREIAELDRALARVAVDRARRVTTEQEANDAAGLLRGEREVLSVRLSAAEQVQGAPPSDAVVKLGRGLRARWPRMTAEEKNRALRTIVAQVRIRRAAFYREPVADRVEVIFL